VKTDKIDLIAIRDLLFSGAGHEASPTIDPVRELEAWAAHRRRRSLARRRTIQQLTTQVDRCFPGLGAVMWSVVLSQAGRLIITELPDPVRVVRLGPTRLRAFAANRDVRMTRPLAEEIVEAARQSLPVHGAEIARTILAADLRLLTDIERQITEAEAAIETILPATPFDVLRTTPGWGPVRVGSYGAAVGEPSRWPSHRQLYRAAGLTPRLYESAGKRRDGAITREGSVTLRVALVDLGMGLWHNDPASKDYAESMRQRGKPGGIITIAMAHRANKIAYAMVRDQQPWDPNRWAG
jgi:transposase